MIYLQVSALPLRPLIQLRSGQVGGSGGWEFRIQRVVLLCQTLAGTPSSTAHTTTVWVGNGDLTGHIPTSTSGIGWNAVFDRPYDYGLPSS